MFYFRRPIAASLAEMHGLDIGARTSRLADEHKGLLSVVPVGRVADDLRERFVPHFRYYEELGCRMRAIDLVAYGTRSGIDEGDARLLPYTDGSFDFITAPMLLGPSHVCASPLEIAFCLGEFRRVLRPGGFVFLADAGVQPSVLFAAQLFGFAALCSKGDVDGLPVGTLLRRAGWHPAPGLSAIFTLQALLELCVSPQGNEVVVSANLLWDPDIPRIRSAGTRSGA